MTSRHASWFVTLLLESRAEGFDPATYASIRAADASRLGIRAESFVYAPLREGATGPELVTILHHEGPLPAELDLAPAGTRDLRTGCYVHLREVPGSLPLDEAPKARGLLLGITDCGDPARLEEFHRFYDENHAVDVVRSPYYERGDRYERVEGDLGGFLALYTNEIGEPEAFRQYLAWPERDKTRCEVFVVRIVGTFQVIPTAG